MPTIGGQNTWAEFEPRTSQRKPGGCRTSVSTHSTVGAAIDNGL